MSDNFRKMSDMTTKTVFKPSPMIAFGSWACNCTIAAASMKGIPDLCPDHQTGLLGPRSWEENTSGVELGLRPDHRLSR